MTREALDPETLPIDTDTYPKPYKSEVSGRTKKVLGDEFGLTHYGVNLVELSPGAWSAQRHWHSHEDEFIYVVKGKLSLITDAGEQVLSAGMVAGFPAGDSNGHHLVNRGAEPATYLEVGDRIPEDECHYPDIDLFLSGGTFFRKNGEPY